jgi:outer membrane protein assembly factor BamC
MKANVVLISVAGYILANLTACSSATQFFPDKERDYQHVKEIPMLNWPKELRTPSASRTPTQTPTPAPSSDNTEPAPSVAQPTTQATTATPPDSAQPVTDSDPAYDLSPEIPAQPRPPSDTDPVPDNTGDSTKPIIVEQVKRDGSSRLRLNVAMLKAWRAVDKALSRNSIEVTERNAEAHRYTVQYDPNEKKAKDGSWMDEINFIFKGFEINEKPYRLTLVESTDYIEVQLVDDKLKLLADTDASLKLLDTLEKTIKADFAEAKK